MNLIAFDPGKTTGVVEYFSDETEVLIFDYSFYHLMQILQRTSFRNYDKIICEDYIIRPDTIKANLGSKLRAVKIIGILEYISHLYQSPLVMQPSSVRTSWPKKRLLAAAERFNVTKEQLNSPHKRDALRHLFYYLERTEGPIITDPEVIE